MRRAELGIDGNAAFAGIGPNIQEGEYEFVTIPPNARDGGDQASRQALQKLRERLAPEVISYWIGPSHPRHC